MLYYTQNREEYNQVHELLEFLYIKQSNGDYGATTSEIFHNIGLENSDFRRITTKLKIRKMLESKRTKNNRSIYNIPEEMITKVRDEIYKENVTWDFK